MKKGLDPVVDEETKILILGSFPGEESLRKQQYYANRNNDFWKLVGQALGEDLERLDYDERIERLKESGIGLWDIYEMAEREGSADSDIEAGEVNDFSLLDSCPNLKLVCFNGKRAASKFRRAEIQLDVETKVLLSSSGANRPRQEKRLEQWQSAISKYTG